MATENAKINLVFALENLAVPDHILEQVKHRLKETLVEEMARANLGGGLQAHPLHTAALADFRFPGGGTTAGFVMRPEAPL